MAYVENKCLGHKINFPDAGKGLRFVFDCQVKIFSAFLCFFLLLLMVMPVQASFNQFATRSQKILSLGGVIDDLQAVRSVRLFYRVTGSHTYTSKPLGITDDGQVSIEFPLDKMMPPGIDYYLLIKMADGTELTDPANYPRYNPYQYEIKNQPTPHLFVAGSEAGLIRPDEALQVTYLSTKSPEIRRVLLDGVDISASVSIDDRRIHYQPPLVMESGQHRLRIDWQDDQYSEVDFQVASEVTEEKTGMLTVNGSLSFHYGGSVSSSSSESNQLSANMHLGMSAEKGDLSMRFSGINMQYVQNAEDKFNLSSGYLLSADYGKQTFELGDLSINETPLTVSGLSRRGIQAKMQYDDMQLHVFNVNSETVQGFNTGLSLSNTDNQIYGVSLISPDTMGKDIKFQLVGVSGSRKSVTGANSSSILPAASGNTLGGKLSGKLLGIDWQGEYALSQYDENIDDNDPSVSDMAYQFNFSRNLPIGNVSLGLLRYGTNYASIANPNFTADQKAYNLGLSSSFGYLKGTVSGRYTEDNVAANPDKPIIASTSGGASISLLLPEWPSIQLAYRQASQNNKQVTSSQPLDNLNKNYSLGIAYNRQDWSMSFFANTGHLDDRLASDDDSITRNYTLSGGVVLAGMNIMPVLSLNETRKASIENRSRLVTLSLSGPLWRDELRLSSQASYQISESSDNSVDSRRSNASLRLSWNLKNLLKRVHAEWSNVQLGLSANYTNFSDANNAANNNHDYSFLVTFSMGAPYNFEVQRPW